MKCVWIKGGGSRDAQRGDADGEDRFYGRCTTLVLLLVKSVTLAGRREPLGFFDKRIVFTLS